MLNEHTQGVSKTTVIPHLKQEQFSHESGQYSLSANNTPTESPSSSPVPSKRSLSKSSKTSRDEYSFSNESSLVDSLNLDHPALTTPGSSASLPHFKRSPGHQRNTSLGGGISSLRRKNRGSKRVSADSDQFDSKRSSTVSVRSDPGDEVKAHPTKHTNGSKAIPNPKSLSSRTGPMNNSPNLYTDGGLPSSLQSAALRRTGSGNRIVTSRKQQSTPLTKGLISVPVGPLIREKPQPPARKTLESEFKVQYSGGGGYGDGYCRQCFAKLQIVVKPCLVFEEFEILTTKR